MQWVSYILVHQACLAYPAVTEDNDLVRISAAFEGEAQWEIYLKEHLLSGCHICDWCLKRIFKAQGKRLGSSAGCSTGPSRAIGSRNSQVDSVEE